MDKQPLVAIVILNYNGKECLPLALQSLFALKYEMKKILVVDNCSQDDSFEQAKKDFPQGIFFQNKSNLGFAGGMNVGIREALRLGADYVWLFNNDAEAGPGALQALIDFCEEHPEAGAVSPLIMNDRKEEWFASGEISYLRMRATHGAKKSDTTPYQSKYLSGCALLIPRSTIDKVGLLDERYFLYYEDVDFSVRICQAKKMLFVVPMAMVRHNEQSERENGRKVYYLVYSGLLFFHDHTPILMRPWMWFYEFLRRVKNRIDIFFRRPRAIIVYQAYQEYDRIRQSKKRAFSYLR